jgi:hypothetical protein
VYSGGIFTARLPLFQCIEYQLSGIDRAKSLSYHCPPKLNLMSKLLVAFSIALLFAIPVTAQSSIHFQGNLGYDFNFVNKSGTINIRKIVNDRNGGTSGTLYVDVWLVRNKYYGSLSIEGQKLAHQRVGELQGGYQYTDLQYSLKWDQSISAGEYYVVYQLAEYSPQGNIDYVLLDYLCFDKKVIVSEEDDDY